METQKITNLLNDSDNESSMELHSKFATRKWYIMAEEVKIIQPLNLKSSLCDYSDAYILVT